MRRVAILALLATGCGKSEAPPPPAPGKAAVKSPETPPKETEVVLYAGRSLSLVKPLIAEFEKKTGLDVKVRDGKSGALAALLLEEKGRSPADVFWAQDAGSLGQVERAGLLRPLPTKLGALPSAGFRGKSSAWVPTSGRARLLAYNTKAVSADALPKSVFDLTDARHRGRVGWAPTNASFQAFVTAMRVVHGDAKTQAWLTAMKDNGAKAYAKNTPIIKALVAGEIDLGLPNHYYLLREKKASPDVTVDQAFFGDGDVGNLLNVAGIGILKSAKHPKAATQFVEFLLSKWAQEYFAQTVLEYPVVEGVKPHQDLPGADVLHRAAPGVSLEKLADLRATRDLLLKAGLL